MTGRSDRRLSAVRRSAIRCIRRRGASCLSRESRAAIMRRTMQRICGGDPDGKLHLLLDFTDRKGEEIADPWYTGDFDAAWEDLLEGCQALLREYR